MEWHDNITRYYGFQLGEMRLDAQRFVSRGRIVGDTEETFDQMLQSLDDTAEISLFGGVGSLCFLLYLGDDSLTSTLS